MTPTTRNAMKKVLKPGSPLQGLDGKSMTNEEIARFFNNARPHIQGNPNLRDPQVEGGSIKALSRIS